MPNFLRNFIFQRMQKKAGDLAAPTITRSVGRLGPRDLPSRFTPTQPMRSLPGAPVQAPGLPKPPAGGARGGGLSPAAAGGITVGGLSAGAVLAGASNLFGDPFGITQALAGTAGKPNQSRMSLLGGVNSDPFIPATTPMQRAKVGQPMVLGGRLGYKTADGSWQPRGDMESENIPEYVQGKGYVYDGQQVAADRDYESQKRRAEQLAQQDQLSKKYRVADLTKAYNTAATPEEKEKIGLEIWGTTNPQLAQKLKPGQLGYEQVQSVQAAQSPFGGALQAAKNIELADKISFDAVPSAGFGIGFGANLNTQIPGAQVPANLQENFAGAFTSPVNVPSFDQAAKLFDPAKISEVDRATLIRLFNEGLQKK